MALVFLPVIVFVVLVVVGCPFAFIMGLTGASHLFQLDLKEWLTFFHRKCFMELIHSATPV